jgi:hypothetical protein
VRRQRLNSAEARRLFNEAIRLSAVDDNLR